MLNVKLQQLLEPTIVALGYELVGVECSWHGERVSLLRVYIDSPQGIAIHDCEQVSYQISGLLDVEDLISGQYTLEVSSPGLERPLFTLEQFAQFIGHKAKIRLNKPFESKRHFTGTLQRIEGQTIVIAVDGTEYAIPYTQVDKAHLVPEGA